MMIIPISEILQGRR